MKKQIKKAVENYSKPTPSKMRKIGDSVLGFGTALTAISAVTGQVWLTVASALATWAGKTITNFWS